MVKVFVKIIFETNEDNTVLYISYSFSLKHSLLDRVTIREDHS